MTNLLILREILTEKRLCGFESFLFCSITIAIPLARTVKKSREPHKYWVLDPRKESDFDVIPLLRGVKNGIFSLQITPETVKMRPRNHQNVRHPLFTGCEKSKIHTVREKGVMHIFV